MKKLILLFTAGISLLILGDPVRGSDVVQYSSNPYTIPISGSTEPYRFGDHFMAYDVNHDGAVDYLYRIPDSLYVYDHYSTGIILWEFYAPVPYKCNGSSFGCADIDGDGQAEVVLLDSSSIVHVINGETGVEERSIALADIGLDTGQKGGYLAVVNIQAQDDWDIIVQTIDETIEGTGRGYYVHRSLIALDMDETIPANMEIWRVEQDGAYPPYYEGYWGQAHGGLMCADVDNDGLDEVVGGSMIDDDGTEVLAVSTSYPETDWVGHHDVCIDHLDALVIGDFRPQLPGLEWCVTQEDWDGEVDWHTVMLHSGGVLWRKETTLYFDLTNDKEAQSLAVGNFDLSRDYAEIWNRSRFMADERNGQHPWVFDNNGDQFADYNMNDILPSGFSDDNRSGIEAIWTIDWDGSGKEYIAGKARENFNHVGIFDATDGTNIWTTLAWDPIMAKTLYVADVAGDSREELVVFDLEDYSLKIFHNEDTYTQTGPDKWDDPLYVRLKQNWSYYSPGGYTQRDPVKVRIRVFLEGPYIVDAKMDTSLKQYDFIPLQSPYSQDPRIVESIPDSTVDWVLVQLRQTSTGDAIASRSCFVKYNGYIITEDTEELNFFVDSSDYYIVIRHRNHLDVMSSSVVTLDTVTSTYDFSTGTGQYEGGDAALLETGIYGMYAGDISNDEVIVLSTEAIQIQADNLSTGYYNSDASLDGAVVQATEITIVQRNNLQITHVQ